MPKVTDLNVVDKLCPCVWSRQDHFETEHTQRMDYAHCELDELRLSDKLLERIFISERGEEIMAVHDAMNNTVDESSKGLGKT